MTFSRQILIGLCGGILTGLFFGETTSAIAWVADGFVKLLQMMVLPYITVSIIASLGSLAPADLRTLGLRAAAVIGGLWLLALAFAFLIPLTFPSLQSASFFSSSLVERRIGFDFIDLYVTANPFHALANNIVPAVVLFSIVLGTALSGVPYRERLLDVLAVTREAIARAMRFVTRLTPYGLFAIAANAAGTLNWQQLGRLQIYLVAYVSVALLVSLWVLPGLIAALTPIRARDVLRESQDSLLTAFIAGDLFIVLPGLTQASRTLLQRLDPGNAEPGRLTEVIVPTSFNFPHTGKLLSLSFVLFAGWFTDTTVPLSEYPQLALAGLVSFFGSLNAAVPFLLDQFRIPADTFQLFLATGVVNSRVGSLVAAVHTITVALLVACAVTGHLRVQRRPLLAYAVVTSGAHRRDARRRPPAVCVNALAAVLEGRRAGVDAAPPDTGPRHPCRDTVAGAAHEPAAARNHCRARAAARRLPDRRPAVRLHEPTGRTGRLRHRARARSRARAGRRPRLRAGRPRFDGGATRRRVLRSRDVRRRRDYRPDA